MLNLPLVRHLLWDIEAEEERECARMTGERERDDERERHPAVRELELRPRSGGRERVVMGARSDDVLAALGVERVVHRHHDRSIRHEPRDEELGHREAERVDAPRPPAEEPVERGPVLGTSEVRRDERARQGTRALGHHPPEHHGHEVLVGGLPREAAAQRGEQGGEAG
ncbi:MAG: hypothetical protein Q8P41_26025 [Pseudomonadota bacterium]|nr:hypothetical protein [Pseudomonadota bacterium]